VTPPDPINAPHGLRLTSMRAVPADGARVGIVSCLECGAALLIDPADSDNVVALHRDFHERLERTLP
jgi:hypothetical protein